MQSYLSDLARTEALALEAAAQLTREDAARSGDDALREALEACINSRLLIAAEQEKTRILIDAAENETERAFRGYQFDLVKLQIERAAEAAELRLALLDSLKSEADYAREREKCRNGADGTIYWFENYSWGFDPRDDSPLQVMPFYPFEFQRNYLRWLEALVFEKRTSGLVEKARDMGATVGALNWTVKQFLFRPHFSAMLVSVTEDLVDSKKDPDTLFEKVRFQLRLTPSWMLPKGFDLNRDTPYMNISNDESGAVISGTAPTANAGRQRRRTFVLADEFAAWPYGGYPQHTALSQTTRSMFKVSSVQGKHNKFAEERHSGNANVFVMDWRDHPWKDQRWYAALPFGYGGAPMSAEVIAQEVDRNYEASQPGRVFPQFRDTHSVITVSELRVYLKKHGVDIPDSGDGLPRMPLEWTLGRANDRGATEGHRNGWLWAATPKASHPLDDSRFIFREYLAPIGASLGEIARAVFDFERRDGESAQGRMTLSLNSHEAEGERVTYAKEYGLHLHKWRTDYENGIAQLVDRFSLHDVDRPHPIRPQLMGRPKIYFIVADGQGELQSNGMGGYFVTGARDSGGLLNLRRQVVGYHYPPEEAGKPAGLMRPRKVDDDLVDPLRAFAVHRFPPQTSMTDAERRNALRPSIIKDENIARLSNEEASRAITGQMIYDAEQREEREFEENARRKSGGRFSTGAGLRGFHAPSFKLPRR
jgi:hypothetical protein